MFSLLSEGNVHTCNTCRATYVCLMVNPHVLCFNNGISGLHTHWVLTSEPLSGSTYLSGCAYFLGSDVLSNFVGFNCQILFRSYLGIR